MPSREFIKGETIEFPSSRCFCSFSKPRLEHYEDKTHNDCRPVRSSHVVRPRGGREAQYAAKFLKTMQDYPPSQSPGSFNLTKIEEQLKKSTGSN